MRPLRALIRDHRALAIWLAALALCLKIMVPPGFMIAPGQSLSIAICTGQGPRTRPFTLPPPHRSPRVPGDAGMGSDSCPYAALGLAMLPGTPPQLAAAALAFILLRATRPTAAPQFARRSYLRPPLRAPPARA